MQVSDEGNLLTVAVVGESIDAALHARCIAAAGPSVEVEERPCVRDRLRVRFRITEHVLVKLAFQSHKDFPLVALLADGKRGFC